MSPFRLGGEKCTGHAMTMNRLLKSIHHRRVAGCTTARLLGRRREKRRLLGMSFAQRNGSIHVE